MITLVEELPTWCISELYYSPDWWYGSNCEMAKATWNLMTDILIMHTHGPQYVCTQRLVSMCILQYIIIIIITTSKYDNIMHNILILLWKHTTTLVVVRAVTVLYAYIMEMVKKYTSLY